jgi:putative colanic acid biosynthesis glycosyltransferase
MQHGTWLTVITVVKNDASGFARTLGSLTLQDLSGVEFVVIDGSEDHDEIPALLDAHNVQARYFWSQPTGIYAAMNKGVAQSLGEYCYFANAGDALYSEDVLARVRVAAHAHPVWLFGPVEIVAVNGKSVITPYWDYQAEKRQCFSRGHFPCHQGTFVRTNVLRALGGFSTEFDIVSDYAIFLQLSAITDPLELDFVIATFVEGGISTSRWRQSLREFHRARLQVLDPRGLRRIRERWNTVLIYARMLVYRTVISDTRRGKP